jgi:hypothetical protein
MSWSGSKSDSKKSDLLPAFRPAFRLPRIQFRLPRAPSWDRIDPDVVSFETMPPNVTGA